ncbi:hypothetical protein TNCV_3848281 [Trichonephila clavipes]|uniref:Uncharacterized protein n=1 Tax=Trichonephila clavipes TaxID=2585209 RepID=A0A8X6UWC2_TRICX|nr:hypothetical protein TNCV_3848281 [Trichonephila clavipes]
MDELNLDQAPQDINKELQLERVRLQAFIAATDPGLADETTSGGDKCLCMSRLCAPDLRCLRVPKSDVLLCPRHVRMVKDLVTLLAKEEY